MVTVEELKEQFPVRDVAPHGKCVVVPVPKFGRGWETDLENQGCKVFSGAEKGIAVFYVRLPKDEKAGDQGTRKWLKGPSWSEKEDQILVALVKEKLSQDQEVDFAEIAKNLPGRSGNGVKMRIRRLHNKGLLSELPRRKLGRKRKSPALPQAPVPTPIPEAAVSISAKDKSIKELLEAAAQLYPDYPFACRVLMEKASESMYQRTLKVGLRGETQNKSAAKS